MQVRSASAHANPAPPRPSAPMPLAQRGLEVGCGAFQAVTKVPGSLLPCLAAGVAQGVAPGMSEQRLALLLDVANGLQVAVGLTLALSHGNFVSTFVTKGLLGGLGVFLVSRGGSNRKLAQEMVRRAPSGNLAGRLLQGVGTGLSTAVVEGARVGFAEGRGLAHGLWEGGAHALEQLQKGPPPQGWLRRIAGGVTGVALAPGSAVDGLAMAVGEGRLASPWLVAGVSTATAAGVGALLGGATGAGIGTALALASSLKAARQAHARVETCVGSLLTSAPDHGHQVVNKNRDFTGSTILGAASGWRAGYESWS